MRRMRWAVWLWPGLPQLWCGGAWSGLLLAIGFAGLLNLLLWATLVWDELIGPPLLGFGWAALGAIWLVSPLVSGWGKWQASLQMPADAGKDLFRRAQCEYLRGNWYETESLLAGLVECEPGDVEARLLLATLLRRLRRFDEAQRQLAWLEKLDAARPWNQEIALERQLIREQAEARQPNAGSESSDSPAAADAA